MKVTVAAKTAVATLAQLQLQCARAAAAANSEQLEAVATGSAMSVMLQNVVILFPALRGCDAAGILRLSCSWRRACTWSPCALVSQEQMCYQSLPRVHNPHSILCSPYKHFKVHLLLQSTFPSFTCFPNFFLGHSMLLKQKDQNGMTTKRYFVFNTNTVRECHCQTVKHCQKIDVCT
jgi:hypothetical protein